MGDDPGDAYVLSPPKLEPYSEETCSNRQSSLFAVGVSSKAWSDYAALPPLGLAASVFS